MSAALWFVQLVLAMVFGVTGVLKLTLQWASLVERMPWVADVGRRAARTIGVLELVGALGLTMPTMVGLFAWAAPLAAGGLAALTIGAGVLHARRREPASIAGNVVLLALAVFVVLGYAFA